MELFIDIETFGQKPEEKELILPTRDDVKLGNLKDVAKIEMKIQEALPVMIAEAKAKHDEAFDKEWRGNALKSTKGSIIAISYAIDNQPVVNLSAKTEKQEVVILNDLNDALGEIAPHIPTLRTVAHYGKGFDFPWLRHRAIKYGFRNIYNAFTYNGRYDNRAVDTLELFQGTDFRNHYSLDSIATFFGLEGKTGMTGADVHDAFLAGEHGKIAEYCGHDVEVLRNVYNKIMRFGK